MTLKIPLGPTTEAELRKRAAAAGKKPEDFVVEVIEEELAINEPAPSLEPASPDKRDAWLAEFHAWVASHPRLDHFVDDSRDSIYSGRGE